MIYWKYLLTFISSWASLNRLPATRWVLTVIRLTNYTKYIITDPLTNTLYQPVIDKTYIFLSCVTSADVKFTLTMNYCFYQKWSADLDWVCWNNRVKVLLVIISRGLKFYWSRASSSFKKTPESKRNKDGSLVLQVKKCSHVMKLFCWLKKFKGFYFGSLSGKV